MRLKIKSKKFSRFMFGFIAVILIALGAYMLNRGFLFFENYWGGAVFAPMVIVGGILLLYVVIFRWEGLYNS